METEMQLTEERVTREFFLEQRARGYIFQPGDFGYENLGEFEAVGLLTSPFPHSHGCTFYVVYANARYERLMIRHELRRDHSVAEGERYRYAYRGAEAY